MTFVGPKRKILYTCRCNEKHNQTWHFVKKVLDKGTKVPLTHYPFLGLCPFSKLKKPWSFGSRLCLRRQIKKRLPSWTPQIQLFSVTGHRLNTKLFKLLKTKRNLFYINTQRVPHSKLNLGYTEPICYCCTGWRGAVHHTLLYRVARSRLTHFKWS